MTVKFMYGIEFAIAPKLCCCTTHQRIVYVKPFTFCAKKHQTFIPPDLWHPNILDLNPVDYNIWVIMQHRVYQTKICSVDEQRVIDLWCCFEQSTINWCRRIRACIHSKGGQFEHSL